MTELASVDLPAVPTYWIDAPLDTLQARLATAGQHLLGRRYELAWDEVDAHAVARRAAAGHDPIVGLLAEPPAQQTARLSGRRVMAPTCGILNATAVCSGR